VSALAPGARQSFSFTLLWTATKCANNDFSNEIGVVASLI
jgi:hypothetical protein